MSPRIKNSFRIRQWLWPASLLALLFLFLAAQPAYAAVDPNIIAPDGTVCPNGMGLTARIVSCLQGPIVKAGADFMTSLFSYMSIALDVACVLAIALWGLAVTAGKRNALTHEGFILAIKIAAVVLTMSSFDVWYPTVLGCMDDILGWVSSYATDSSSLANNAACDVPGLDPNFAVWNTLDCALQILVGGIYNPTTLGLGILGFLFACLLSSTLGMLIALLGVYLIGSFLITIARALYIYISAYLGIAVMFTILPLVLPTILFTTTKPYFDKWLRLTMTFMLQPVILFAYLTMLVCAFDTVVYTGPNSLYHAIAGPAVDDPGFEIGAWLFDNSDQADPTERIYSTSEIGGVAIELDPKQVQNVLGMPVPVDEGLLGVTAQAANAQALDWQDDIFKSLGVGSGLINEPNLPTTVINWTNAADYAGVGNQTTYVIELLLALVMAAVTSYLLLKLLEFVPYIGAGIAGIPIGMPIFGVANAGGDMSPPGSGMMGKIQGKLGETFNKAVGKGAGA